MSLYRIYRPQTFEDVVGQEHVARTLRNALTAQPPRVAHAYLFTGPRGIGKTTNARLLAKCLNCENGPTPTPCNKCDFCVRVSNNQPVMDLVEIDAASNTGVDNVRENIIDKVNMAPAQGRYRVTIVDECFAFGEPVTLADGSRVPIGQIVENELPVSVLSYNEATRRTEAKPVARWMKKQPYLPCVRVYFDNNRSIVCTFNHKFYTPQGQRHAAELEAGDFVYANYESITQHQFDVVAGAAVGDGHLHLTGSKMRGRLSMTHGAAQLEYLNYKTQLLGDLVATPPRFQPVTAGQFSKVGTYAANTLSRPHIALLHDELYQDGRKTITADYLERIDELGLALWYLDDGSLLHGGSSQILKDGTRSFYPNSRSVFNVQGLSVAQAHLILDWLGETWGIAGGVSDNAKGPVVWLTLPGTRRLHQIISSFVPPKMQYKLLPEFRDEFEMPVDDGQSAGLSMSRVRRVEPVKAPDFVYNIEVEDNHNYFVRDMLVANCHMLSTTSFNALLKTIEEPPPHAIFILATTETHKVPQTIISRCQRFDFRRVTPADIAARLMYVAGCEKMTLQSDAAKLIARHADGALRDGLTLLEQVSAFSAEEISAADVRLVLGGVPQELLDGLIESVANCDAASVFGLIEKAVEEGASFAQMSRDLTAYARDLLLLTVGHNGDENLSAPERANRARHAEMLGRARLERLITLLREAEKEMRQSTDHRLLLELTLVRACDGAALPAPASMPAPAAGAAPQRAAKAPREIAESDDDNYAPAEPPAPPAWRKPVRENILAPKAPAPPAIEDANVESETSEVEHENSEVENENSKVENVTSEVADENSEVENETSEIERENPEDETSEVADENPDVEVAPAPVAEEPASKKKRGRRIHDFDSLVELWPAVIMRIRKKIGVTAVAYLHDARPVGFSDDELILEFYKEFHFAKATEASKRLPFEEKINETLDKPRRLRFQMAAPPAPKAEAAPPPIEDDEDDDDLGSAGDIIEYAQNMFGAQIMGRSG